MPEILSTYVRLHLIFYFGGWQQTSDDMAFDYWQKWEEGGVYHIYHKAISNVKLFRAEEDYEIFLARLKKYFENYFSIYSYCLIPNHYHLLVRVKTREEVEPSLKNEKTNAAAHYLAGTVSIDVLISDQFRRFHSSFAITYKNKYNVEGSIFIKKMKRVQVKADGSIQRLIAYIHHNPIHHKLKSTFVDWPYSSYSKYYQKHETELVSVSELLEWLGGLDVFEAIHVNYLKDRKMDILDID